MVEFHVQAVPRMNLAFDTSICMAGMLVCDIRDQLVYVSGTMSAALPRAWYGVVAGSMYKSEGCASLQSSETYSLIFSCIDQLPTRLYTGFRAKTLIACLVEHTCLLAPGPHTYSQSS